jgi:hypothetical protein
VAPLRARARRDVTARVSAAAPGSAPTTPSAFPLDSAGVGWDAAELHALTGLAWTFTTPSSTDGRKIVKAASAIANRSLKGSSNWRKEDWEAAAKRADVRFLDTFSTLPGMRGFRACWAPNGDRAAVRPGRAQVLLRERRQAMASPTQSAQNERGGRRRRRARRTLCRVKKGFEEQYLDRRATQDAATGGGASRAARDAAERAAGVLDAQSAEQDERDEQERTRATGSVSKDDAAGDGIRADSSNGSLVARRRVRCACVSRGPTKHVRLA